MSKDNKKTGLHASVHEKVQEAQGREEEMRRIAFILVLIAMVGSASGEQNDCEKLAKDYRNIHGGDLILIQPLKDNGMYDLGEYSGHWVNRAW